MPLSVCSLDMYTLMICGCVEEYCSGVTRYIDHKKSGRGDVTGMWIYSNSICLAEAAPATDEYTV